MKKSLMALLVVLFIIPLVSSAENDISLSSYNVQFGDSFVIDGDNIKHTGSDFTGNGMINFYGPNGDFVLLTQIVDGHFSQSAGFCKFGCIFPDDSGNYSIGISLLDASLVELEEFIIPGYLVVDSSLDIVMGLENVQINPGDKIKLEGSVQRGVDSKVLESGDVKIIFDEVEYKTSISNEKFVYEFITGIDISSGYHDLDVSITDSQGNYGEGTMQFFVVGIPQLLNINFEKDSYFPDEVVAVIPSLVDQAGEEIIEEVELKIYDGKGKRQVKEIVLSNDDFDYVLEKYAVPGEWRVSAKAAGLKVERYFNVEIVEKVGLSLNGQFLEITNVGNVPYSNPLLIEDEMGKVVERRTNLAPGENMSLILYTVFDEGQQTFKVLNNDETFSLEVIDNRNFGEKFGDLFEGVTGQAIRSSGTGTSDTPFLILVGLIFGMLIYTSFVLRKKIKFKGIKLKKSKIKVSSEDVDDIKSRILKDIKDSKMSRKNEDSFIVDPVVRAEEPKRMQFDEPMRKDDVPKKDESSGSLFKMFD